MFEKLDAVEKRLEELTAQLYDPAVAADRDRYRGLMKESASLTPLVETYRAYKRAKETLEEARALLDAGGADRELRELAEQELADSRAETERLAEELKGLLLPRDPNDERNVIMEIRGGAGGGGIRPVRRVAVSDVFHVRGGKGLSH